MTTDDFQHKDCTKCGETKSLSEYYKRLDGHSYRCKPCVKEQTKARYASNAERYRAEARAYRKANPEKVKARRLAWKQANPEKNVKSVVEYQRRNPEKHALSAKKYRENNLHLYREYAHRRNEKLKDNGVYLVTEKEVSKLLQSPCVHCGKLEAQTLDHIIPIDLGGTHSVGNLQTLCLSCNSSKRNRVMTVWRKLKHVPFSGSVTKL